MHRDKLPAGITLLFLAYAVALGVIWIGVSNLAVRGRVSANGPRDEADLDGPSLVGPDEAVEAALRVFPGEVVGADVEDEEGSPAYVFCVSDGEGVLREVLVGAEDGGVLEVWTRDEERLWLKDG